VIHSNINNNGFKVFMKNNVILFFLFICFSISYAAEKTVYIPSAIKNSMDVNNSSSKWCYDRSSESDNIVVSGRQDTGVIRHLPAVITGWI
jgi:hypothetical protein